ncbi:ABC transporter ATP-binding protein [Paenibacillus sp. DCT19]|uniref:ABC transporter ATP-binding protein n=1 Tax=Paenibacillus sp. DCT19 TaxID=2211212 RepID=UPI000FE1CC4A|nr:ABC transporter ATP-binding protein [Paenibacillus sp. DCT19]
MVKKIVFLPHWFRSLLKQNKLHLCVLLLLLIIIGACETLTPIIIQRFIDNATTSAEVLQLFQLAISFLVITFFNYVLKLLNAYYSNRVTWNICEEIRITCLNRMKHYDKAFEQKYGVGKIMDYLSTDISEINYFITRTLLPTIIDAVTMLAIVIVVVNESLVLGLFFITYFSFAAFVIYKTQNKKSNVLGKERAVESEISSLINEIVLARKEIKVMKGVNAFTSKLASSMDELFPYKLASQKYIYTIWIISLFFISLTNVLALGLGGTLYFFGVISLGTVYLVYNYSQQLKQPLETIQYHINNYLLVKQAMSRLTDILEYQSSVAQGNQHLPDGLVSVTVKQLRFSYEDDKSVLEDINFTLEAGESLGIIGVSGSGKSTLSLLLTKQLPCPNHSVYISGVDINELSLTEIQRHICLMSINDKLFEGSLKDNLTLFDDGISDHQVLHFIEKYQFKQISPYFKPFEQNELLHKKIDLQELSVGEKQLIYLFRLVFKPKKLIIFDEALSNIDKKIEYYFFDILKEISENTTLIMISHNVERLRNCNNIIVMEKGKVIGNDKAHTVLDRLDRQRYGLHLSGGEA